MATIDKLEHLNILTSKDVFNHVKTGFSFDHPSEENRFEATQIIF